MDTGAAVACSGCGLVIEGGLAACEQLFEERRLREFSDPR